MRLSDRMGRLAPKVRNRSRAAPVDIPTGTRRQSEVIQRQLDAQKGSVKGGNDGCESVCFSSPVGEPSVPPPRSHSAPRGRRRPLSLSAVPRPLITDFQVVSTASDAADPGRVQRDRPPLLGAGPVPERLQPDAALHRAGNQGQGVTVAVVDSFGSQTLAADLANFNTQFGLQHMCGEANHTCAPGDPKFSILCVQACTDAKSTANGHQQDRSAWSGRGLARCRVGSRRRAQGQRAARHNSNRRDPRRCGTPADDECRAVRDRPPPGAGDQPELRRIRGDVQRHGSPREPSRRVQVREAEQRDASSPHRATSATPTSQRHRSAEPIPIRSFSFPTSAGRVPTHS